MLTSAIIDTDHRSVYSRWQNMKMDFKNWRAMNTKYENSENLTLHNKISKSYTIKV